MDPSALIFGAYKFSIKFPLVIAEKALFTLFSSSFQALPAPVLRFLFRIYV